MAIAFVKKSAQSFGDGVSSFSTSLASVVAGNLVIVTVDKASGGDSNNPALAMPTPSGWSVAVANTGPTGTGAYRPVNAIFYKLASAGGTETANWASLPSDSYIQATISEYSCSGTWALDAATSNTGDSSGPGSVSGISNSTAVALAVAIVATDANSISNLVGPTSGYTQLSLSDNNAAHNCYGDGYKILSATGAQSAGWTWTTSGPWMGSLAIFREVAGGGTSLTPGQDAISLTGFAPTLAQTANQSLVPGADAIAILGLAPTLVQTANQSLVPGVDAVSITGFAPTLTQTAGTTLTPGQAGLTVTGLAPVLVQTANQALTPAPDSVVITGYAPTVVQASASVSLTPGAAQIIVSGYAPSLVQTGQDPYPLGGGGAPLSYYPSAFEIRDQERRERLAAWVKEEQAITRRQQRRPRRAERQTQPLDLPRPSFLSAEPKPEPQPKPSPKAAAVAKAAQARRQAESPQAQAEKQRIVAEAAEVERVEQERQAKERRQRNRRKVMQFAAEFFFS